jgi:hypothetical protein
VAFKVCNPERPRASIPASRITGGAVVLVPAKTGVLPVWACGLGRTLLAVEVRNAYWRQFHAMRVQAFNTTVFPRDSTAKPLHIRTAISSQGDLCLRIRRRWGPSGSRSPRYRGGSSNGWRRRRRWGDLRKDFPVCGFQSGYLAHHLVLTGGELLHSLPQRS